MHTKNSVSDPPFRIPTNDEIQSLINSGWERITQNGVRGILFGTAPNQIFVPAVGRLQATNGQLNNPSSNPATSFWSSVGTDALHAWNFQSWESPPRSPSIGNVSRLEGYQLRLVAIEPPPPKRDPHSKIVTNIGFGVQGGRNVLVEHYVYFNESGEKQTGRAVHVMP